MGPLSLRPATDADRPDILRLWAELAVAHGSEPWPEAETAARLEKLLAAGHRALMIEQAGAAIGYMMCRDMGDHLFLRHFALTADARGRGLGRAAFRLLQAQAPQAQIRLDASDDNPAARRFWAALGFRATAVSMRLDPAGAA